MNQTRTQLSVALRQARTLTLPAAVLAVVINLLAVLPASAHDAPSGSEWVMADWMFLSFVIFAGAAFTAFLFALKSGLLSNLEDAKYYVLEIDEPDYYTPEWAKPGGDA